MTFRFFMYLSQSRDHNIDSIIRFFPDYDYIYRKIVKVQIYFGYIIIIADIFQYNIEFIFYSERIPINQYGCIDIG